MISVGNERVPTALVSARAGDGRTRCRILRVDLKHMLIVVPLVGRVEMTIMQIVNVTLMQDRHVSTLSAVEMGMLIVSGMAHQKAPLAALNDI